MKKINIAVVGLNWGQMIIDEHFINGPASPYFKLAAVCRREKALADACAAKYGVKAYYDLGTLLADPEIDAICLMTGPVGRAELIDQIIGAGKQVMTTKPIEVDPAAAMAVLLKAKQLKRVVHLNSPTPTLSPDLMQIKRWEKDLEMGRPVAVRADIWSSYREAPDGGWYDDPMRCPVAPIFRLGIYLINDLIRLFGEPESVCVMSSRLFTGRPTPDNAQLGLKFKNGVLATVFASFCVNDGQWWLSSLTMNYENGTIYRNVRPVKTGQARQQPEMTAVVRRDGKSVSHSAIAAGSTEDYQWDVFYRAINGEPIPGETTPSEIVSGLKVIEAMARAEKSGKIELI